MIFTLLFVFYYMSNHHHAWVSTVNKYTVLNDNRVVLSTMGLDPQKKSLEVKPVDVQ